MSQCGPKVFCNTHSLSGGLVAVVVATVISNHANHLKYVRFTSDLIIRIKSFRLIFGSITDRDHQGRVTGTTINNQANFSLIIIDNHKGQHFFSNLFNTADDSPDQTIDRIKI
jgi:hypothetical protein